MTHIVFVFQYLFVLDYGDVLYNHAIYLLVLCYLELLKETSIFDLSMKTVFVNAITKQACVEINRVLANSKSFNKHGNYFVLRPSPPTESTFGTVHEIYLKYPTHVRSIKVNLRSAFFCL